MKHTAGPWTVLMHKQACYYEDEVKDGYVVEGPTYIPDYEYPMLCESDATLMAAAPDLIIALKNFVDGCSTSIDAFAVARAAIAKATWGTDDAMG
jgi:hypothetical protein